MKPSAELTDDDLKKMTRLLHEAGVFRAVACAGEEILAAGDFCPMAFMETLKREASSRLLKIQKISGFTDAQMQVLLSDAEGSA